MNDNQAHINFYPLDRIRRRAKQRAYMRTGLKRLVATPLLGMILLLLILGITIGAWYIVPRYIPNMTAIMQLIPILIIAARILILIVVLLVSTGLLWLLGRPAKAQIIDDDIAATLGFTKSNSPYYRRPFLISATSIAGTDAIEYIFWARWIDPHQWNQPETKSAILRTLHVHTDEDFSCGKQKYTVTIRAVPGAIAQERETPQSVPQTHDRYNEYSAFGNEKGTGH